LRNLAKRGLLRSVSNLSLWHEERERETETERERETEREERKEGERKGLGTMASTPLPYK